MNRGRNNFHKRKKYCGNCECWIQMVRECTSGYQKLGTNPDRNDCCEDWRRGWVVPKDCCENDCEDCVLGMDCDARWIISESNREPHPDLRVCGNCGHIGLENYEPLLICTHKGSPRYHKLKAINYIDFDFKACTHWVFNREGME